VHVDYNRSSIETDGYPAGVNPDYSRNRYFAGVTFTY
jgi:hypothetical protein